MIPPVLERFQGAIEETLDRLLPSPDVEPAELHAAMRHSVLAGGKRIRPVLALAAYESCGGRETGAVLPAACALELLHTYSLIHDDLPAMDDDTLRRGRPTCHVVFGEATAILAGDALQTLGAYLLAAEPRGARWAVRRNRVSREVLDALGTAGMAGGQALDLRLTGTGEAVDGPLLERLHRMKTGRFLEACLLAGAHWAGAPAARRKALKRYGEALGLAFQVVDDILDATGTDASLGKTAGKDAAQKTATFVALWGLEGARRTARDLLSGALRALDGFGPECQDLRELARYVVGRSR